MDLNNLLKKIEEGVELENKFISFYTNFKKEYLIYKESVRKELEYSSKDIISNLELIHAYIIKHNEVKTIYKSYKQILKKLLDYRNRMKQLSTMSKPLISGNKMEVLLDEQIKIKQMVDKINEVFNKQKVTIPRVN